MCACVVSIFLVISRDIKIKSRAEFEEDFDGIKDLIAAKTLFMVDDKISMFEEVSEGGDLDDNNELEHRDTTWRCETLS